MDVRYAEPTLGFTWLLVGLAAFAAMAVVLRHKPSMRMAPFIVLGSVASGLARAWSAGSTPRGIDVVIVTESIVIGAIVCAALSIAVLLTREHASRTPPPAIARYFFVCAASIVAGGSSIVALLLGGVLVSSLFS